MVIELRSQTDSNHSGKNNPADSIRNKRVCICKHISYWLNCDGSTVETY